MSDDLNADPSADSESVDTTDKQGEQAKQDDKAKVVSYSQEQVDALLARATAPLQRKLGKLKKDSTQDNKQDTSVDANAVLSEIQQERNLLRFERWLTKKDVDPRAIDLLSKHVDLADPETWDDAFERYADLFGAKKTDTKVTSPSKTGGTKGQPNDERPVVNIHGLTKEQLAKMSFKERMDYAKAQFDKLAGK